MSTIILLLALLFSDEVIQIGQIEQGKSIDIPQPGRADIISLELLFRPGLTNATNLTVMTTVSTNGAQGSVDVPAVAGDEAVIVMRWLCGPPDQPTPITMQSPTGGVDTLIPLRRYNGALIPNQAKARIGEAIGQPLVRPPYTNVVGPEVRTAQRKFYEDGGQKGWRP